MKTTYKQASHSEYPTKEEILEHEIEHKKELYPIIIKWKKEWKNAKNSDESTRFETLSALVQRLADLYEKPITVEYEPETHSCCYNSKTKTLTINKTLSILSTMHEFAHHLYGSSEKQACRWSVWLFMKTFPIAYKKLEWKGHMLIRKTQTK